ncbi:MAG: holin family protein [Pseudomonadota bacterium]
MMGILSWLFGGGVREITGGVKDVAQVFRVNAEAEAERAHLEEVDARAQFAAEFRAEPGMFNRLMDAVNRLPRPALALGCLGLFVYAMSDPVGFAARMQGLQLVPEPLWWLLGAIVSFYFGARELQYLRSDRRAIAPEDVARTMRRVQEIEAMEPPAAPAQPAQVAPPRAVVHAPDASDADEQPAVQDDPGAAFVDNPALAEFARS